MSTEEMSVGPVNESGKLDKSRSLHYYPETEKEFELPVIPRGWTTLHHGTNLNRHEWSGKEDTLDMPIIEITKPLSVVSTRQREESNTTQAYSANVEGNASDSKPVEFQILFPDFSSRRKLNLTETMNRWQQNLSEQRATEALSFVDKVYWNNHMAGRDHPYIPKGSHLIRLGEQKNGDRRIIYYVPEEIKDIYDSDLPAKEPEDN